MTEELLTIEEVATMLDMHTRTIRRYIKEGKLTAVKVGGRWRVKKIDLKKLMGDEGFNEEAKESWHEKVAGFIGKFEVKNEKKIETCSIIDVQVDSVEEADEITGKLISLMNCDDPERKWAKFQYMFNTEINKARYIFHGNPKFIMKMYDVLAAYED